MPSPKQLSIPPYEGVQRYLDWLVCVFCSSLDVIQLQGDELKQDDSEV